MKNSIQESLKARIRKIAKETRIDPAQLWQNLVLERFLIRLSQSRYSQNFILKGGVLLAQYIDINRHTQDLDFLIQQLKNEVKQLEQVLSEIIEVPIDDGFYFSDLTLLNPKKAFSLLS